MGPCGVLAEERGAGQQAGGLAQAAPGWGTPGYPGVGHPGGLGVGVGGLADHPAAQRGGGRVQRVRRRPGRVGGGRRIVAARCLIRSRASWAVRAACYQIALRSSGVNSAGLAWRAGAVPAAAELEQSQVGRELPASNHTGPAARAVSPTSATA